MSLRRKKVIRDATITPGVVESGKVGYGNNFERIVGTGQIIGSRSVKLVPGDKTRSDVSLHFNVLCCVGGQATIITSEDSYYKDWGTRGSIVVDDYPKACRINNVLYPIVISEERCIVVTSADRVTDASYYNTYFYIGRKKHNTKEIHIGGKNADIEIIY